MSGEVDIARMVNAGGDLGQYADMFTGLTRLAIAGRVEEAMQKAMAEGIEQRVAVLDMVVGLYGHAYLVGFDAAKGFVVPDFPFEDR